MLFKRFALYKCTFYLLTLLTYLLFVSLSLIDVASAEQTAVSHSALMKILNFNDDENIEQAERYLLATALSTHPSDVTLKHLLVCLMLCVFVCLRRTLLNFQLFNFQLLSEIHVTNVHDQ